MLKKYSIVAILFFAYSIVLGHSIIPHHHHHDNEQEMSQSLEHHDSDHHHNDDNDDDGSLAHEFEKYIHSSGTGDVYQKSELRIDNTVLATVYMVAVFDYIITPVDSPPSLRPLVDDQIPIALRCLSPKGLRAPPLV